MDLKLIDLSNEDEKIKTAYRIILILSVIVMVTTITYGIAVAIIQGVDVVGETFVTVEFPPPELIPIFYAKPVTWLAASIIAFWFSFFELNKNRILRLPRSFRKICIFIAFFMAAMAFYEVLFNFTIWGALMAKEAIVGELNPDLLQNPFPNPEKPWNLVFATKLFLVVTVIALYTFYFLLRLEYKKQEKV
ncbi:MAG: hypothetical protein L6M37_00860 [Candidatus Methylarchaceae archaeon HK02M1]|nr:hypothetical protein [Candidatus Methylarchaceae archaeon HK02M1]